MAMVKTSASVRTIARLELNLRLRLGVMLGFELKLGTVRGFEWQVNTSFHAAYMCIWPVIKLLKNNVSLKLVEVL
jgi:hypothetical protein